MKKSLKLLTISALAVGMIVAGAGCGGGGNESAEGGTITWYMAKPVNDMSHQSLVEEAANKIIEPAIGRKLHFEFIDRGNWDQKMNVIIQSGEEFDLSFDAGTRFTTNVANNAYIDLTPYLDKAPDIKAKLNDFAWEAVTFDGKGIMAVPSQTNMTPYSSIAIKKDIADKYNIDYENLGTSFEELEPILKTIKENEPNMYPIIAAANSSIPSPQSHDFLKTTLDAMRFDVKADKFVSFLEDADELKRFETTYDWYQKGYIAKDAASKTEVNSEIKSGRYAVFGGRRSAAKTSNLYGFECVESKPSFGVICRENVTNSLTAVSRTSKQPEKCIELLNLIWKDTDLSNLLAYGVEGTDWVDITKEGAPYKTIEPKSGNEVKWSVWHNWLGPLWDQWDSVWNSRESLEEMQQLNNTAEVSTILAFVPDVSEFSTEIAMINSAYAEVTPVFNTGSMPDYDAYFAEVQKKFEEAGIDKVIDAVNKQYQEWKSKQ